MLKKVQARKTRHLRIRKKISGTAIIPRLVVFKSNKNFYAQLVDDTAHKILAAASTLQLDLKTTNKTDCEKVGKDMAKKIKALKIETVVFDRAGYLYHGKLASFADAIRAEGIKF